MDGPWAVVSSLHLKSFEKEGGSGIAKLARVNIVSFFRSVFVKICI